MSLFYLRPSLLFLQGINRHSRCSRSSLSFAIHPAPPPSPSTHLCATPPYLPSTQMPRPAHPMHRPNLPLPRCTASIPVPKGEGKTQELQDQADISTGKSGTTCLDTELPLLHMAAYRAQGKEVSSKVLGFGLSSKVLFNF